MRRRGHHRTVMYFADTLDTTYYRDMKNYEKCELDIIMRPCDHEKSVIGEILKSWNAAITRPKAVKNLINEINAENIFKIIHINSNGGLLDSEIVIRFENIEDLIMFKLMYL